MIVPLERLLQGPRRRLPDLNRVIVRARGHELRVRREGYRRNRIAMPLERLLQGPRRRLPDLNCLVSGARGHELRVRRESYRRNFITVSRESLLTRAPRFLYDRLYPYPLWLFVRK